METYLLFPRLGTAVPIEASSMAATSDSIRFFNGKKLIAVFDRAEISKAGLARLFPDEKITNPELLSVERLNDWLVKLPQAEADRLTN